MPSRSREKVSISEQFPRFASVDVSVASLKRFVYFRHKFRKVEFYSATQSFSTDKSVILAKRDVLLKMSGCDWKVSHSIRYSYLPYWFVRIATDKSIPCRSHCPPAHSYSPSTPNKKTIVHVVSSRCFTSDIYI